MIIRLLQYLGSILRAFAKSINSAHPFTPPQTMSISRPQQRPPITLLPTELWFLIIANLDLPSLEKSMCAFYSLFRTLSIEPTIEPKVLPSLLRWLNYASGTQAVVAKLPFEVIDDIFQLLDPQDKVNVAVALWTPRRRHGRGIGQGELNGGHDAA